MTHLNAGDAGIVASSDMLRCPQSLARHLDSKGLRASIARRRDFLLNLELEMVAACEAAAARDRADGVRMDDRETWDRATWTRYLAAAARLEPEFGPPMRRLLREIDQLERVLALAVAMEAAA